MPIIEPANTQQVLQMSPAVEKVFTEQQVHHAGDQARLEEQLDRDEKKRTEVQDLEETNPTQPADPEGKGGRRKLIIKKKQVSTEMKEEPLSTAHPPVAEGEQGSQLDILA